MNIFVLDENPKIAARMACNKHVVKMVTETAQILCSVFEDGTAPYRRSHYNHPCCKWARASQANYCWLLIHGIALSREYTRRYSRVHAASKAIEWCANNRGVLLFPSFTRTPHPQCMPGEHKRANPVAGYRNYYVRDKAYFAKWPEGKVPDWWPTVQKLLT